MSSDGLHESPEALSNETKDVHRAIVSLMEELEAVDWYQQRAEACTDDALRAILVHNKNEEIEHAMMTLEWLRRNQPKFDENIATYIGSRGPITEVEEATKDEGGGDDAKRSSGGAGGAPAVHDASSTKASPGTAGSLGIGSLKGR